MSHRTTPQRFWSLVDKSGECWIWTAAKAPNGYGKVRVNGRTVSCHRYAYELTYGAIPPGMQVCHHCDNRPCVRPDHLFLGTVQDNADDMVAKGRQAYGVRNNHVRLSPEQVLAIRAEYRPGAITHLQLAERYGVCKATITHILSGRNWKQCPTTI